MKKLLCLCLLFVGCAYSPRYYMVRDSYNTNTYAPVYAPTYAPVYSTNTVSEYKQKALPKKEKKLKVKIYPNRGEDQ